LDKSKVQNEVQPATSGKGDSPIFPVRPSATDSALGKTGAVPDGLQAEVQPAANKPPEQSPYPAVAAYPSPLPSKLPSAPSIEAAPDSGNTPAPAGLVKFSQPAAAPVETLPSGPVVHVPAPELTTSPPLVVEDVSNQTRAVAAAAVSSRQALPAIEAPSVQPILPVAKAPLPPSVQFGVKTPSTETGLPAPKAPLLQSVLPATKAPVTTRQVPASPPNLSQPRMPIVESSTASTTRSPEPMSNKPRQPATQTASAQQPAQAAATPSQTAVTPAERAFSQPPPQVAKTATSQPAGPVATSPPSPAPAPVAKQPTPVATPAASQPYPSTGAPAWSPPELDTAKNRLAPASEPPAASSDSYSRAIKAFQSPPAIHPPVNAAPMPWRNAQPAR
jgi:hypothetical protein